MKERAVSAFKNQCCACKIQDTNYSIYDFHHINPEEKEMEISMAQTNGAKSWMKIRDELKKCIMLCANCHRKIHNSGLEIQEFTYFDENYYEWDMMLYAQVVERDGILVPLDIDETRLLCPKCGGNKSLNAECCIDCSKKVHKDDRPSKDELKKLIRGFPFTTIGAQYGVSDNAIRKWCDGYGLPRRKKDIQELSDEDWNKL